MQDVMVRFSSKVENHAACELTWIQNLIKELSVETKKLMVMSCDNQVATYIPSNPMFHECIKHIEVM